MPSARRDKLPGVSGARAQQILAGALIAQQTMAALDIPAVEVCPWALREGIMLHYLQETNNEAPMVGGLHSG